MDVQAAPPTYTASSATKPVMGNPPVLGQQVPGTTGGLPALSGLSVTNNPMAQQLQSYGRGDDSMLVHMTPAEVNSLQGLAMAHGGSLTINPHTGLPEAGILGKLLPTLLGGLGMAFGIPPIWMGALGAVGGTVATGDLGKGLMMGLQAYGGASLGGAAGIGGKLGSVGKDLGLSGASAIGGGTSAASGAGNLLGGNTTPFGGLFGTGAQTAKSAGALGGFTNAAKAGAGFLGNKAPLLAGAGVLSAASEASKPNLPKYTPEEPGLKYTPMAGLQRKTRFQTPEQMEASGGAEYQYFTPVNPDPMPLDAPVQKVGFADGGSVFEAPAGFNELVASYNAANPGAITASMKYPSAGAGADTAVPVSEAQYFKPTTPATTAPTTPTTPTTPGTTFDPNNIDWASILGPGASGVGNVNYVAPTPQLQDRLDNGTAPNRLEDFSNIGDYSVPFTPPANTGYQGTPTTQPVQQVPDYTRPDISSEAPIYVAATPEAQNRLDNYGYVPGVEPNRMEDFSNIGDYSSRYTAPRFADLAPIEADSMQSLPMQQSVYQQPTYDYPAYTPPSYDYASYLQDVYTPPSSVLYSPAPADYDARQTEYTGGSYGGGGSGDYTSRNDVEMLARGGGVNMRDGAFVVDARTVSELGNGSSNAGIEALMRMGGQPVRGPGDGVSDSVPAKIGGKQKARVARDEVIFQPEAVRRIGGGSEKRGTQKLYALMDKAHKARKKAKRGQDTGVRKGLA